MNWEEDKTKKRIKQVGRIEKKKALHQNAT